MSVPFNTVNGYGPTSLGVKGTLSNAAAGYVDPVTGAPLNTAADFLMSALIELRKLAGVAQAGLNVQDGAEWVYTDPSVTPQPTGAAPVFS